MAWLGVGQERERGGERIIWRGFHEINRYFHRDLSSISFRFFSSILSVRTSWVQLRADPPSIEQKILILPFVSILIVTRRRHENARESLSLFGLLSSFISIRRFSAFSSFSPFLGSRGVVQEFHRVHRRVSVFYAYESNSGDPIKRKHE